MSWEPGAAGILVPFMNQEGPLLNAFLNDDTRPQFAIGSPVRFRWIVPSGSAPIGFTLYMHGTRAANADVNHEVIAVIAPGQWVADGNFAFHDITWDVYYFDSLLPDVTPGHYSICLNYNGRHYKERDGTAVLIREADGNRYHNDGGFILTPPANIYDNNLTERTEEHSTTAGEKAEFLDEFITLGQIEPGRGIRLRYRDDVGAVDTYKTDLASRRNIIVETSISAGTNEEIYMFPLTGDAVMTTNKSSDVVNELFFTKERDWLYDNAGNRLDLVEVDEWGQESIPIRFRRYKSHTGGMRISARTAHNGLWLSHDDGVAVTQYGNGVQGTVAHLRLLDTETAKFTIGEDTFQAERVGHRNGVSISVDVVPQVIPELGVTYNGLAVSTSDVLNIDVRDDQIIPQGYDAVEFTVYESAPGFIVLSAKVPTSALQIQKDDVNVGADDTEIINFDNTTAPDLGYDPVEFRVTDAGSGKRVIGAQILSKSGNPLKILEWYGEAAEPNRVNENNSFEDPFGQRADFLIGPYGLMNRPYTAAHGISNTIIDHQSSFEQQLDVQFYYLRGTGPRIGYARPMQIMEDGLYHINTKLHGVHELQPECANRYGSIAYHLKLQLGFNSGGVARYTHTLDLWRWRNIQYYGRFFTKQSGGWEYEADRVLPWFLDGHIRAWFPAGTLVWSRMIVHWPYLREFSYIDIIPQYHNFEIEKISSTEPDTENDYPIYFTLDRVYE